MTLLRTFSQADQEAFARWSGDRNPIHMDPLAARRSMAGAPVVHGMHLLLWTLDEALSDPEQMAAGIRADFRKFVLLGQSVSLEKGSDRTGQARWRLLTDDGVVATVQFRPSKFSKPTWAVPDAVQSEGIQVPSIEDMRRASGQLTALISDIAREFPNIAGRLSEQTLAALARISAVVGMVCPGLHSILSAVDVDLSSSAETAAALSFRTGKLDERYRLVGLDVAGPGVQGSVEAFIRPEAVEPLSIAHATELVEPHQFAGRRALVVGGSRGLGAVTTKLLAAGGADVTITYATGSGGAAAICNEIAVRGQGECIALALDVCGDVGGQLAGMPLNPTDIYYFATPQIFLQKKPAFDRQVFDRFADFYVSGFNAVCMFFAARSAQRLQVLYPSSVAVAERPAGLTEYAMAKAAGELLCADLMRLQPNLQITVERLPRVLTDQTQTIQRTPGASPEDIMLPLLTR